MNKEEGIRQNTQHEIRLFHPIPAVPDYTAFQRPIVAVGKEVRGELVRLVSVSIEHSTEYLYLTDLPNYRILIFSQTGDYINHFGSTHLLKPWGILTNQDNIYVTDIGHNAIFLFRLPHLEMIGRVGKHGSAREEFNSPRQLAISPNHLLYVPDQYNNRVQVLTTSLKFQDTLQHRTMTQPCDVKFSYSEMYVLSYDNNPCIHVFTLKGEKTRSFVAKEHGMIGSPWFFCLDGHNNILISYCLDKNIRVFSTEGELQHKINAGIQKWFLGITVHNNRSLVCISRDDRYCLLLFST